MVMAYSAFHDVQENEEIKKYKDDLTKESEELVLKMFPKKVIELGQLLETDLFRVSELSVFHADLKVPIPPSPPSQLTVSNGPMDQAHKKRKFDGTVGYVDFVDSALPIGTKHPPQFTSQVPTNAMLVAIVDLIKPEIIEALDSCNKIKVWIQLRIPKIEDGNNFGVSIQEDILAEVSKAENDVAKFLEQISRYFGVRAKLVSEVAKYPHLDDYRRSVDEYDEKVFLSFKIILMELRNIYAVLYDVIVKNFEKIKQPRSSHSTSLY